MAITALLEVRYPLVVDVDTGKDITKWAVASARVEAARQEVEVEAKKLGIWTTRTT